MSSEGGKKTAIMQRKRAIELYYKNPKVCLFCNNIIKIKDGQRVSETRRKKFCNQSCVAKYKNRDKEKVPSSVKCESCGDEVSLRQNNNNTYIKRKYCDKCLRENRAKSKGAETYIGNLTKDQIFNRHTKYYIGRNRIRSHAQKVFEKSCKNKKCIICGYDKHVDVSHIKGVSDFNGDALISKINSIENLVSLCPNHHWEYDNGILCLPPLG